MLVKTKIVCTMGPSVDQYEKILQLIDAGMNVARLNFSHGSHEEHLKTIELLKKARKEKNVPLAIMLDTKGPEIRIGKVPGNSLVLASGQRIELVRPSKKQAEHHIVLTPELVFDSLEKGMTILFDDGYIITEVVETTPSGVILEAKNSGILKNQKGVNIPNVKIPLPAMTQEDIDSISFGCKHDIEIIAASFIRSADHLKEIRKLLAANGKPDTFLIAKIEDIQGVQNFDEIVLEADGIMVARGDLGVELPLQEVPNLQKMMIRKSYSLGKPVITATQMLESMIKNPRPTRAEVSDVANAIYDSTSAVMLSGETAVGLYPIETVQMMKQIIVEAEKNFNYRGFFHQDSAKTCQDIPSSVALAAVRTAYNTPAKAIFVFTDSGSSARSISQFRPEIPIVALTPSAKRYHQMALCWGVVCMNPYQTKNLEEAFSFACQFAISRQLAQKGDVVVVTAGEPFGIRGSTNTMIVERVV
jgi:pyruvate kinase